MDNEKKSEKKYPDQRGKRPTDINQLALWIVEQSTENPPEQAKKPKTSIDTTKNAHPDSKP